MSEPVQEELPFHNQFPDLRRQSSHFRLPLTRPPANNPLTRFFHALSRFGRTARSPAIIGSSVSSQRLPRLEFRSEPTLSRNLPALSGAYRKHLSKPAPPQGP